MESQQDVRVAMVELEREVARVEGSQGSLAVAASLRSAMTSLIGALNLGPPPETAPCPHCGAIGMRAATRCGTCWKALTPPLSTAGGRA